MYDRWVADALGKRVAKGKMTQKEMDQVAGRITGTSHCTDPAPCDLVIEAAVKKTSDETFAALMAFAEKNGKVAIAVLSIQVSRIMTD